MSHRNEQINSMLAADVANLAAITEAFLLLLNEGDGAESSPDQLLKFAVAILLEQGLQITVDRLRMIAAKRAIGLSAEEAVEVIMGEDEFIFMGGRVQFNGEECV